MRVSGSPKGYQQGTRRSKGRFKVVPEGFRGHQEVDRVFQGPFRGLQGGARRSQVCFRGLMDVSGSLRRVQGCKRRFMGSHRVPGEFQWNSAEYQGVSGGTKMSQRRSQDPRGFHGGTLRSLVHFGGVPGGIWGASEYLRSVPGYLEGVLG